MKNKLECPGCGMILQAHKNEGKLWCPECRLSEVTGLSPEAILEMSEEEEEEEE